MKLYIYNSNPNGTADLIVTDDDGQVVASIAEAVFGNVRAKQFSWSGDALGNITACYYGESVGLVNYDDECLEEIQNGENSEIQQVVEISFQTAIEHAAVSPVSDATGEIKALKKFLKVKGA